jgi:autotransporter-associated beta strand protein
VDTWTGAAGTGNWADLNWTGVNDPPLAGDTLAFGTTVGTTGGLNTNNFATTNVYYGLSFNSGAPSFTLYGAPITNTGAIVDNSANLQTIKLPVILGVTTNITVAGGGSLTISNVISGGFGFTNSGAGLLTLAYTNTYTGPTAVTAGTLTVSPTGWLNAGAYGGAITNTAIFNYQGTNTQTLSGAVDNSGTINLTGTNTERLSGAITNIGFINVSGGPGSQTLAGPITNSGTITLNGTGAEIISGTVTNSGTITFNNAATNTLSGTVAGTGALNQSGSGVLTVSGNLSAFTGPTSVNAGELIAATGASFGGAITVAAGATNGVQVNGTGVNGTAGQATFSSVTFSSGATYAIVSFTVSPSSTLAPMLVTNLILTGTPTILVSGNAGIAPGQYPLIKYGTLAGAAPTALTVSITGVTGTLVNNTANKSFDLLVAAGNGNQVTWTAGSGTWNTSAANWTDGVETKNYADPDFVVFPDTLTTAAGGSIAVTLNTTVNPTNVLINNSLDSYTIVGSGRIAGGGSLTKEGLNSLTLTNNETFSGGVTLSAGTTTLDFTAGATNNIVSSNAPLTLGGVTLNVIGNVSGLSSQGFTSTTLSSGDSLVNLTGTTPTLALSNLTVTPGAVVEFVGPAATNVSGTSVAATGTITTTTLGGGGVGLLGGNGTTTGSYAIVGLYDWASTFLPATGTNGTPPYPVVGGSQVPGFYAPNGTGNNTLTGNVDMTAATAGSHNTDNVGTIRFNVAGGCVWSPGSVVTTGGILVTPNVGAANVTIQGNAGELEPSRGGASSTVFWQNNVEGFLIGNVNNFFNDAKSGPGTLILAGLGTMEFNFPSTYTGPSFIEGSAVAYLQGNYLGAPATNQTLTLNGGTILGGASFALDNGSSASAHPIVLGNNGGGLAAVAATSLTVDGVVSGTGPLIIGIPATSANGNSTIGRVPGTGTGTANTTEVDATGTVVLSGANTAVGGTVLDSGVLNVASAASLPTGGLTFNGGTFQWLAATPDISAQTVTIGPVGGVLDVNSHTVSLANGIGNGGSGGLTVASTTAGGTLNLNGANTYTGNTTINGGATLGGSGSLAGNVTALADASFALSGNVGGALTLSSGATATLTGLASSHQIVTGVATFNGNAVTVNIPSPGLTAGNVYTILSASSVSGTPVLAGETGAGVLAGQTFVLGTTATTVTLTVGSTGTPATWTDGASTGLWSTPGNWTASAGAPPPKNPGDSATFGTGASPVDLNVSETVGALSFTNASSYTISEPGGTILTLDNTGKGATITVNAGTANNVQPPILLNDNLTTTVAGGKSVAIAGNISSTSTSETVTVKGPGTNILSGANSYGPAAGTTGTTLNGGAVLQVGNNSALSAGDLSASQNSTIQEGAAGLVLANNIALATGNTTVDNNGGNSATLTGTISGVGGLAAANSAGVGPAGTLTLAPTSGANTYTGPTTINAGTVSISADADLGAAPASPTLDSIILNGGDLLVNTSGITLSANRGIGIGSSSSVNTAATTGLIDGTGSLSVGGNIASAGNNGVNNLTVNANGGSGTVALDGVGSYNGTTVIGGGATLELDNANALAASTLQYDAGTLTFNGITAASIGGLKSDPAFTSQTLTLENAASAAVALTVGGNNSSNIFYGGFADGGVGGSLIKAGAGTLILAGSSTIAGNTAVNGGTLEITNGGSLSDAGMTGQGIWVAGGTLNNTGTTTLNAVNNAFSQTGGTVTAAAFNGVTGTDGLGITLSGGSFTCTSMNLFRTADNAVVPTIAAPAPAPTTSGLYVNGATVDINGALVFGDSNSSSSAREDSGNVTVTGEVEVGSDTSGGRWSILQVNGGTFTASDTANGIVINAGATAGSDSEVLLSGGTTTAGIINFGVSGGGASLGDLIVSNAVLYVGSGGIQQPNTSQITLIGLTSGILGATANWSEASTLTNQLGSEFTFQTADSSGAPWNITLNGPVVNAPGDTGGVVAAGGGILALASPYNTYTGGSVISNAAILSFVPGSLGTGGITFYNGTLQWGAGNTSDISSQAVTFDTGGATLDINGNSMTLANSIGNSGPGALTVINSSLTAGTLTLASPSGNHYSGGTTVDAGTLVVNNTSGSATGSGNVTVASGATLQGSASLTGNVEIQGGGTLAPGNNNVGTLTVGALSLDAGAIMNVEFLGAANSKIVGAGLTVDDGDLFNLYTSGSVIPWTQAGTYTLIHYTGADPALDSTWTTSSATNPHILNPQQTTCLYSFAASGGVLSLTIAAAANSAASEWTNSLGGSWSVANNWSPNKVPHSPGDQATFGLGGSSVTDVNLNANESVGELTFNNGNSFVIANSGNSVLTLDNTGLGVSVYVEEGAANQIQTAVALNDNVTNVILSGASLKWTGVVSNSVNGPFVLAADGLGTLALFGANTYGPAASSGFGTILSGGGTLQVGNSSALGAGDLSIASSSTLQAGASSLNLANNIDLATGATATVDSQADSLTLSGTISDNGSLTKIGGGTLTLAGANSYNGPTTINAGVVSISADNNLGSSDETAVVLDGGDLLGAAGTTLNRNVNIGPASGSDGTNALIDAAATGLFTITTVIGSAGNLGTNNLVVNSQPGSTGTLELDGANTFNGTTVVSNGILMVGLVAALQDSTVNLNNPFGTVEFDGNANITAATFGGLAGGYPLALTNTSSAGVALTVGGNNASTTYSGGLNDGGLGGALVKNGTGTLTLAGSNYYTGTTTVNAGRLEITNGGVLNVGTLAGQGYLVDGGVLTNASTTSSFIGSAANTFLETAGTVNVGGLTQNYTGTADFLFQIRGGMFSATSLSMGRGTDGNQYPTAPTATAPIAAATTVGLYVDSTNTASPAQVYLGQLTIANAAATSDTSARMDAGGMTVTNEVLIGDQATTGRWTLMQINGGNFTNLDTVNGIVISQNTVAANDSELYLSGGNSYAQLIQFGTVNDTITGGAGFLIIRTNAALYLGSGGIVQSTPGSVGSTSATISLLGGTLGATANWSPTLPMLLEGGTSTIQAGDPSGNSWNISDSGNLSGPGGLLKTGGGILTLSGTNSWSGPTIINSGLLALSGDGVNTGILLDTVSIAVESPGVLDPTGLAGETLDVGTAIAQTLSGNGSINNNVVIGASGTLTPGPATGYGTLTITNNLTVSGAITMYVDHPAAGATNDSVTANSLTIGAGAKLNVVQGTNDLRTGDTFQLFDIATGSPLYTAANLTITLPTSAPVSHLPYSWNTNTLASNGRITLVSGAPANQTPTNMVYNLSANRTTLTIGWPASQIGWRLVYQSNSVTTGLLTNSTDWITVPGSTNSNSAIITVGDTNEVFFQLVYP